jgi:hypothetical protein
LATKLRILKGLFSSSRVLFHSGMPYGNGVTKQEQFQSHLKLLHFKHNQLNGTICTACSLAEELEGSGPAIFTHYKL